jgi:signal transduction histidine kinase/predicted small secreted protein
MKLCLGILLMTVPIFLISLGVFYQQSRNILLHEAMTRVNGTLNTMMQRIVLHLTTVEVATNSNSWIVEEQLDPDTMLTVSHRVVQLNSYIDGCSISTEPDVFPKFGRYFSAYTVREPDTITTVIEEEYEYFSKVWYKKPRMQDEPCWVVYFDESDSLELTLDGMIASYSKPLYKENKFVGIISTDLALLHFSKVISAEKPYPNAYYMMIDEEGHYLIHPDSTCLFTKTIFTDIDPKLHPDIVALGHEMTAGKRGNMHVNIDNQPCLACYQPVPGTKWCLALICPDKDILQAYYKLAFIIIALIVIGLIVIFAFCYRVTSSAIKPIGKLAEMTQQIGEGNYDQTIARSKHKNAIGELQDNFAVMQESLARHVNDIRQGNDEAQRHNEELVEATRLAEEASRQKAVFIQNISHQIRTPLNIIMGFAQVLRGSFGQMPEEEARNLTGLMDHNAKTLSRMVMMLFDSSEYGITKDLISNKNEVVSCNEVAREGIEHSNGHFPELPIEFMTEVTDDFCIHTNRLYLMRSIREILYNSAKYSDGNYISLRVTLTASNVRFIFEDTGPGIDKAYHKMIYEPFTKINDLSEGLGLGLPLSKRHIINLGGELTLDETYTEGCRFIIELPRQ